MDNENELLTITQNWESYDIFNKETNYYFIDWCYADH